MKKIKLLILAGVIFAMMGSAKSWAVDFSIDLIIPSSNTATFNVSKVFPFDPTIFTDDVFDPLGEILSLNFGTLSLAPSGVFTTDEAGNSQAPLNGQAFYFVLDVGSNGAGGPDLALSYTDDSSPGATGLGERTVINFSEISGPVGSQVATAIGTPVALRDVPSSIDENTFINGFLRIGIGLATGDPTADEGAAEPFTALDTPGPYSGTLTISATFD